MEGEKLGMKQNKDRQSNMSVKKKEKGKLEHKNICKFELVIT